ncbi:hypothetical protein ALC60_14278 [Trachymyrmex zeteki]|uniref:MYND-type domain-containing protein n=1 Tax=Mycetomoellerius zeteki TaxID=64791 RepID=A0A151WG19_9HYME|nr:hypothetical protein ALC60_14278 [Trachymyrmex zeteki]
MLIKEDVNKAKIYLESKNPQTESQPIETNSKTTIKRKIRSGSLDRNISLIKVRRENEVNMSPKKVVADSTIGISHYEMLSDNELVHTTNQRNEASTKCIIRERGSSKFLKRIRERHRKENNMKIIKIRAKFHECFRRNFDPDTSESEEEREILLNLKKNKQQFDEPLHNNITEEKVEYIFERNKLTHDLSANNWQKNIESTIPDKIRSDNLHDSTVSDKEYTLHDAVTEKQIEDSTSLDKCATLINNSQESTENINLDNLCDSSTCAEKFDTMSDVTTDEEISICKRINTSINDPQKDISENMYSDISCDSDACTEKYSPSNVTTDEEAEKALICERGTSDNNFQKNKNIESAIPLEVMADNSCNSTVNTGKYVKHNTITDEKRDGASSIYKHSTSNDSQEHIKSTISAEVNFDNSCISISNIEKYSTDNIVTDEKTEDGVSTCKCDTPVNNSQENIESVIPVEVQFDNSCDSECEIHSTVSVENHDSMHDIAKDDKVKNRAICKHNMSANESENIENVVSAEKQGIQNSSSINDTENNSKCDISAKHNMPSTIEINLDENMSIENIYLNKNIKKKADTTYKKAEEVSVQSALQNLQKNQEMRNVESIDLAQRKNMQKNATSNLELLIMSTFESTSYNVGKKDNRDMLEKNVENLSLSSNDNIGKDEKTIDQLSMITSKLKKNSSEEKSNDSFSISQSNSSSKSNYSDNCSLDIHLTDDDNSSDIEVEIKIKPKLKSRVSRKFSLKAPWSAVNTCIKNLHTLKDNPSFLNELLQMDHRTFEKSNRKITNTREKEDNTSLDNVNVTAETDEIICDSSPTTKDDENHSQQRNSPDRPILNEDRNMIAYDDEKEKDECTQSLIQTTPIITENNLDSSRLVCDTSDLGKQSQKVITNDKQKNNEEQNFQDKTTLEGTKNVVEHNQVEEVEILSVERKKPQITTENSSKSIKAAYDTPDVAEQLPQTSSDMTHKKVRVRSIAELSCQCVEKSSPNASIPRSVCSAFCQSASQSATIHSISSQSAPQSTSFQPAPPSVFFQSAPSQSILFQPVLPQSTCPQLGHPSLVPPRFTSSQSTSSQSVSKRPPPSSYNATFKHTYLSPNTSSAVAPVEINTPNNNNALRNLIQITIKNICTHVGYCRSLNQYNHVRINFPKDYVQGLSTTMQQISQDLENLKTWLNMKDIDSTLIHINFYMPKNQPVTVSELKNYVQICYDLYFSQQNYANSLQYPNISRLLSNASLSNVNAQQFSRNASFPDARIPNRDTFMQSSTMPCPAPTIPNISQQQLIRNSANSTQVPHSRQSRPNIHQSYMSYVPPTAQSHMPNVNQQQSLENTSHPVQGRYMPANMLNVGVQQGLVIMSNISSSNVNMHSYESVNQGNTNVSPTTNTRQVYTTLQQNTISNTATASAANNMEQQKQMYPQTSQINSRTTVYPPPMTNQNNSLGIRQTVPGYDNVNLTGSFTINPDTSRTNAAMGNARHRSTNVNQQQVNCNPQVSQISSGKTQFLPQYDPKQTYFIVSQSAHCNIQTHPVQNTLPDQNNMQQNMSQHKLPVNQGNANMLPTINTKQSHITSKNPINSTTVKSQRVISEDISICPINLSINNTLQNMQENVLNKEAEIAESQNTNLMQKKSQSINLQQDAHQEILSGCNKLQNVSTVSETSTQRLSILQSMMSTISPKKNNAVLFLSEIERKKQRNKVTFSNNLAILTDIQKILLRDQIKSYFIMWDELKNLLSKQEFERVHNERIILFYSYLNLDDYIKSMINESQTVKKSVEKSSQDNTSQNKSTLQANTIETSVDKLTKAQLNQDNENSLECNRILEKQSEQSIDPNISKSPKFTAVKSNLEASNEKSPYTSVITKKSLPKNIRLQEQDNTLKKQSKKSSLIDMEKESQKMENIRETSDIVTLNSSKQNDATSQAQYNTKDQNEKVYNTNNEISNKNLRVGMRDNVKENIGILNSTKLQSDPLNILRISESSSSNIIQESISPRKYLGKKCESTEISEPHIADEEHVEATSEFCLNIQQQDPTNERSNDSTETFESFGKLYIDESAMQNQCDKISSFEEDNLKSQDSIELFDTISCDSVKVTSFSLLKNTAKEDLSNTHQDFKTETQDIEEFNEHEELNEHQSLEIEKMQLQNVSLKFEDECNMRESVIQSSNTIKKHEDIIEENDELLIVEEVDFQEMSLKHKVSKDTLHVEESMIESIYLKHPEDIEEKKIEINTQKLPENIEEEKTEIDTYSIIEMANKNSEQSLLTIEEIGFQKISKFRDPEDTSSIEDNSIESIYLQLPEDIEEEMINIDTQELLEDIEKKKTKMDTHSGIKAINEQLKHVSEQKYGKSRTRALNSFPRDDSLDVNETEVSAKTDFLDADDVEYLSLKSDDSNSMPSILNIRSISPSSFEKMKNINAFLENNSESLIENDENSLDINDNLGISDEIDERLCLRCKRKSVVYCQACLEAHYCSKRCSSLHWNAEHYKQCKGRNSIICIDE